MASMNGILSPPPNTDSNTSAIHLPAKRKRDDVPAEEDNEKVASAGNTSASSVLSPEHSKLLVSLLIDLLRSHDTELSILTHAIPNNSFSPPPQSKRQKSEDGSDERTTILARFESDAYASLDEVLDDIDATVTAIEDNLTLPNRAAHDGHVSIPSNHTGLSLKLIAFKQWAHELVSRAKFSAAEEVAASGGLIKVAGHNGVVAENLTHINAGKGNHKMVLTLFGRAPGPKQLFSSLQIPTDVPEGRSTKVLQDIREVGLPIGITATQIIPVQSTGLADDRKRMPTLGELFPTPSSVPALLPPKPSKIATTRSSTVGWYQPATMESPSRAASYNRQSISSGQWLDYSNIASPVQSRKKRDRALSLGNGKMTIPDVDPSESEAAKIESLFRSAYSSFGPSRDDSAAIIPTGIMDHIWWQEVGGRSFERMIENVERLDMATCADVSLEEKNVDHEDFIMSEAGFEELENDAIDPSLILLDEKSAEEKDTEEILREISDLLVTLNSFQRNRHLSLNSASRSMGMVSGSDSTSPGAPIQPNEPEQNIYEILKSQLTLMIASLPPYAVAKLSADRLSDLGISAKIEVQTNNYKGLMDDDETLARVKAATLSGVASGARPGSTSTLHRGGHSSTIYGNQYSAQRSTAPVSQQYYSNLQTPVRPPSALQRVPATAPAPYQAQRPAAASNTRPTSYGTPSSYSSTVRSAQGGYSTSSQQSQYSQTQPYLRGQGQAFSQHPQTVSAAMNGRYAGAQQPYSTPGQSSHNGAGHQYGNSSQVSRQASPQKSLYNQQPVSGARPVSYSPTPSQTQDSRQYNQGQYNQNTLAQAVNGVGSRTAQQQYPTHSSGMNWSTHISPQQQQAIIAEQRARMSATQQSTQIQARNVAQAALASPGMK